MRIGYLSYSYIYKLAERSDLEYARRLAYIRRTHRTEKFPWKGRREGWGAVRNVHVVRGGWL